MAQWLARWPHKPEVSGSNPFTRLLFLHFFVQPNKIETGRMK